MNTPAPDASPSAPSLEAEAETRSADRGPGGRKDERIRLEGTPALGIVRVGGKTSTVKVLDLSRGGVCLLVEQTDLPESFPGPPPGSHGARRRTNLAPRLLPPAPRGKTAGGLLVYPHL